MNVGIIGTGNIGETLARHLVAAGHDVILSNSRGPESLSDLVEDLGEHACATTPAETVDHAEVVVLALPWRARDELPAGELFADKIVVDATNPYSADFEVMDLGEETSSEVIAEQLPDARLVKAFNTMYWETLRDEARPDAPAEDRLVIFMAGDDRHAKDVVADLVREVGFVAMDTGGLVEGGRLQEPGSAIYDEPMTPPEAREVLASLREPSN
ncbi:NADPH-dependent F420 reductase [Haloarchaeobius amylolyticus]|uniref:NADPH-dependent F420 reductase n=1 Tax=Haloarchaeobius amylolyticus TaxID=1198296 RepID=UPI002270929B|nr:NADPH-dependent F420 reductase [Haloarchaeobius amylolyticus]